MRYPTPVCEQQLSPPPPSALTMHSTLRLAVGLPTLAAIHEEHAPRDRQQGLRCLLDGRADEGGDNRKRCHKAACALTIVVESTLLALKLKSDAPGQLLCSL